MKEEENILKLIAEGDRKAFALLYAQYSSLVYNLALSFCSDSGLAEDITQEVFTKIFRYAGKFEGRSSVKTWIYRIAVNTSLQSNKRPRNRPFEILRDEPSMQGHPGIELEKREKAAELKKAIDQLPENQKVAFTMSFIEELPRQEVADLMEISLKATESLLQRAKKKLREILRDVYLEIYEA